MYNIPRKPIHMQPGMGDMVVPSTGGSPSWRNVDNRQTQYSISSERCNGSTPFRRFPDGKLDVAYVGFKVMDAITKLKDLGDPKLLTQGEAAVISLVVPHMPVMDSAMASLVARLSLEEILEVRMWLSAKEAAIAHYNAGHGAGRLPGDFMEVDKSLKEDKDKDEELFEGKDPRESLKDGTGPHGRGEGPGKGKGCGGSELGKSLSAMEDLLKDAE